MRITRRSFLRILPPLILPALPFPLGADEPSDAVFIVIDGARPTTPPSLLRAFVEPFLGKGIPIGLILDPASASSSALADQARQIFAEAPDLVEPVLSLPGLSGLPRYFQRRNASDAMQRIGDLLDDAAGAPRPFPVTIATDAPPASNFDALRCLGIRNVLTLSAEQAVSSTGCAERTVCLRGSLWVTVAEAADPVPRTEAAFAAPGWNQMVFSLGGGDHLSVSDVQLRAQRASDAIGREIASGRRFAALPREHARWFGEDQQRFIALRIGPGTPMSSAARDIFLDELRANGIAVTDTLPLVTDGAAPWPGLACATLPGPGTFSAGSDGAFPPAGLLCLAADSLAAPLPPDLETSIDLLLAAGADPAFDDRGLFIRGETAPANAAALLASGQMMRDAILAIGPGDYATVHARRATIDTLRRFQQDEGTRLLDLPAFFTATVAPDPVFDLLRETRRETRDAAGPEALSGDELLADARQAWRYFERFSVKATGLCIDTADVQADYTWLHRELTMWDMGSLFAAVMAAHELGLIPDEEFIVRSELMVRALPVARIGGLLLPSEVISPDTGAPLSDDFNACDTGRLLSVLRELDIHPLTRGIAAERIARWDLGGVIVDGHVHSVVNGRLVDRFRSHCAHYTARAFRERGLEVASPYEVTDAGSKTDREMLLLQALIGLDPLGAEPLLLEALEMGLSEPSDLLADVLFGAQKREYESSGVLTCLSEAPINREPWFTYQGLNVASSEERWVMNASSADPRFATPGFAHEIQLVNTKAAYLWVATRPCAYSTLLVRHVRDRARLDGMGFAPGVYVASGKGMPGYSDVNTNGIVLEAIAFTMRGRIPRANLQAPPGP